jgi:hypothetical protein
VVGPNFRRPQQATVGHERTFARPPKCLMASFHPGAGAVAGLLLAMMVHWAAPVDIDAVQAGAWCVRIGRAAGLAWGTIGSKRSK